MKQKSKCRIRETESASRRTRTISQTIVSGMKQITVSDITLVSKDGKVTNFRRLYPTKATKRIQAIEKSTEGLKNRNVAKREYRVDEDGLINFGDLL